MGAWRSWRSSGVRRRGAAGFSVALAAFALLCGVLLLLGNSWSCRSEPPVQVERARQQVQATLGRLRAAEQAIAKQNFGLARATLREASSALQQALADLTPVKERPPARP